VPLLFLKELKNLDSRFIMDWQLVVSEEIHSYGVEIGEEASW
jgi:hypothetical protein